MGQVKYLRFLSEKNINVVCANRRITLSVDNQIIDEKQLSFLTCDQDLKLYSASSTYEVKINQYGYVSFQRI